MGSFESFEKISFDVPADIIKIGDEHKLKYSDVDFSIISTKTFYHYDDDAEKVVDRVFSDEELRDPSLKFRQENKLHFHPKTVDSDFNVVFDFMLNKTKTKVYAFINPRSKIPLTNSVLKKMTDAILMKKLRLGLFINIFEPNLEQEIKSFLKILKEKKKLQKPYKMLS